MAGALPDEPPNLSGVPANLFSYVCLLGARSPSALNVPLRPGQIAET